MISRFGADTRFEARETPVDEALFVDFPNEARSGLHLHGAPVILQRLERCWERREEQASVDLFQELLTRAQTEAQLALAIEQSSYGPDDWVRDSESGQPAKGEALRIALRTAQALLEPLDLAFVGRQNAGKSTLFNRLLMLERNLTGPMPGLTRDAIREVVDLDGYPVRLVDTAGLRAADGVARIAALHTHGAGRIEVMAGSGINSGNVRRIVEATGVRARKPCDAATSMHPPAK